MKRLHPALVHAIVVAVLVLAGTTIVFVRREHKRRKALPPTEAEAAEEPEETEPKPLTREDILAIADSVSPRARHSA